jgi:metallophosphoesterase superfamily enzyme
MPQTRFVKENTEIKKVVEQTAFEKYDKGAELSREERERIRLAQSGKLDIFKEVEVKKDTKVDTLQDREEIREVIVQPIIERHQQAVVTEVHEKKVIVEHEHPVVRKIVEKPIVREIIHTGTTIETKKL